VTWTEALAPGARSPKAQVSVCEGGAPVIVQLPGPAYAGLIDQETPDPPGSGSLKVPPIAVPVPDAALLLAVMVKPIGLPAFTLGASAVLLRVTRGCGGTTPGGGCETVPVGVGVLVGVAVEVTVGVDVVVAVAVGTDVLVGAAVAVAVADAVAVGVEVLVGMGVLVGVGISVGVAVGGGDALGA